MKLKLTLSSRFTILKALNEKQKELSLLEVIICNEITDMLRLRSSDIEKYELKHEDDKMTWNQEKDLQQPLEIELNQPQVQFLQNIKLPSQPPG